jgi:hypothetical protein
MIRSILATLFVSTLALTACDRTVEPPSPEQRASILKGAPQVFATHDDHVTMAGIETIYLGQPKDAALEALAEFCPKTMEYRGGKLAEDAWFRGCVFQEPIGPIVSIRIGFWPRLGDQVSTLEVKRNDVRLDAVRERFRELVGDVTFDVPHPGMVEMRAQKFQMIADIDEGAQGPTHITFGYSRPWAKRLENESPEDS